MKMKMKMKMVYVLVLLLLFLCAVAHISHSSSHSYYSDQHALLSFKNSLSFHSLHDWSPNHNTCNWTGVACTHRHRQRVVSLSLTGMSLLGPISPFIGNLSFLRGLALWNNSFYGHIPPQLGRLFRLRILDLSINDLEGSIPSTLRGCRSLQFLILFDNHLNGTIPSHLGLLSHLDTIALAENKLTGPIPSSLGNLSSLTGLDLHQNRLHGSIPFQLGLLSQLEIIGLAVNQLTGTIPSSLGNLSSLTALGLEQNRLHGGIPVELGMLTQLQTLLLNANSFTGPITTTLSNCTHLQYLQLYENFLTGHIPLQFGKLSELRIIRLWGNQLTGEIPSSLSNCSLRFIEIGHNNLSGTVPLEFGKLLHLRWLELANCCLVSGSSGLSILAALTNCSYLERLYLSDNYFTGVLPSSVGRLSRALSYLGLNGNKIEGNIPGEIGTLTNLTYIDLSDNLLNGTIPSTLNQLPNLERLYLEKNKLYRTIPKHLGQVKRLGVLSLSENMLSGQIPNSLGDLSQLRDLRLDHNQLSGQIPVSLGRCKNLATIDLSYNNLTGNIPPEVAGLPNLQFYFNISINLLQGSLSAMSKMVMVQAIDVSHNNFSDGIPAALSSCINLQYLNLSWNSFDGSIPASLTYLKNLVDIDLSSNNLSGAIPMDFKEMKMLQHINLSSNRLTGEVPMGGVFATLNESAVMRNPGLCGAWINLQPCSHSKHKHFSVSKKVMVPVVIGISIFIMSLLLLVYSYRRRHTSQKMVVFNVGPPRISYEELVEATGGFIQTNLLGVGSFGSVYRGILKNGTNIAIKVLNLKDDNAHQSFIKECNVLKRVRHRNVIKIISACSKPDFKALVLPFMSNGSLDKWLHPQGEEECRLNLNDRIKIAMDIAQGIAYLHHHCFVQVIHCDLKPKNVLLGDDMTPYIADFGISKLIFGNSMDLLTSTNALKGSIGYIAPEYGMGGNLSTKGDVYSYGILLLELLTRRKPTDDIFVEGHQINLQKWVGMDFPNKIKEVVDNNLFSDVNESEMSKVLVCLTQFIQVGMACTSELPQQRPNMMQIVERLEKIRGAFLGTPMNFQLPINITPLLVETRGTRNIDSGSHEDWSTSTS